MVVCFFLGGGGFGPAAAMAISEFRISGFGCHNNKNCFGGRFLGNDG